MLPYMTIEEQVKEWVNKNLNKNFKFRDHQFECIVDIIQTVLDKDESNQIIEAPTGSGKSIIIMISAGVLSDYYDRKSYILCSDLSLWDQYYRFIIENRLNFGYLKGQTGNYQCSLNKNTVRCGECRIAGQYWSYLMSKNNNTFPCAKDCVYVKDRKRACLKKVTLMTYQCYLYTLMHQEYTDSDNFELSPSPREIIFCDECHHMPDVVMLQFSPQINHSDIELAYKVYDELEHLGTVKFNKTATEFNNKLLDIYNKLTNLELSNEDNLNLVKDYYAEYNILWDAVKYQQEEYKRLYKKLKVKQKKSISKTYRDFEAVIIYGDQFRDLIEYLPDSNYLVKELVDNTLNFYNLKQDFLVYKCLLSKSKHRIMTSATVGDAKVFANNIGVDYLENKTCNFTRIPSTFDFSKSPITVYGSYKMNWQNKKEVFPLIQDLTYNICNNHVNDRGLIQTSSYADAISIYNNAPRGIKRRLLIYKNSKEKDVILRLHKQNQDSIVIGPTLNEGLDLPEELCRFIIITKIPYPQLNSEFVKRKMELFKDWYQSATSVKLIQSIGRGVRNNKDWCKTYILDGCFFDLLRKTKSQYPQELLDRIVVKMN